MSTNSNIVCMRNYEFQFKNDELVNNLAKCNVGEVNEAAKCVVRYTNNMIGYVGLHECGISNTCSSKELKSRKAGWDKSKGVLDSFASEYDSISIANKVCDDLKGLIKQCDDELKKVSDNDKKEAKSNVGEFFRNIGDTMADHPTLLCAGLGVLGTVSFAGAYFAEKPANNQDSKQGANNPKGEKRPNQNGKTGNGVPQKKAKPNPCEGLTGSERKFCERKKFN